MFRIYNIYALAAFGTIGGMLFGFDISSMSAWIGADSYKEYFDHPGSTLQGGITASMSGGSLVGALIAGFLADSWGRRGALKLASIIWIIGAVLQCSSQNVAHLIVGRVVSGLAIGITSSQCCVYLAELAPSHIRGRIVGIQQWSIEWGILIMYLISYGCIVSIPNDPKAFRIAWGVQGIPGLILGIALFFFPESPRWLGQKDRWEECHEVLSHLHAGGDREAPVVLAELDEVREAARVAAESRNSGNVALTSSIIQYVIFLVTTGAILPIIDRLGRRPLLIGGAIICCIIHFTTGAVMKVHGNPVDSVNGDSNLKWEVTGPPAKGVIALSYIFVGVYGLTWAPIGWIYASEVFPLKYRATGVGLAAASNWAFNLALAFFVLPAFTNIQWKTYMIFGTFCAAMTVHIFFTYPETSGKTLEEIDELFDSNIPAWRTGSAGVRFEDRVAAAGGKKEGLNTSHAEKVDV
ncbi:hypothetical protein CSAL01_04607 [Colletotrichum salicis]|uniref:Major facilitator superfamily (MFS) profile domain-containing protein n=1 Tax=Colletotrichum salicis TaxID=1209931 RepID=A0A135S6Q8_9PEZI|nr:hypothetical protein CSAL01_04607 [Colletotrichum salicis]